MPDIANNNKPQLTRIHIYWQILAFILCIFMVLLCVRWMVENPGTASMDEAVYLNQVHEDRATLRDRGFYKFARSVLYNDRARPPAYRWLVMPLIPVTDNPSLLTFRITSLAYFVAAIFFLYFAVARIAGSSAGVLAILMLILSPVVLVAIRNFGTTFPLVLAISAMFYFLFKVWDTSNQKWYDWMGLGVALAAGVLAKITFVLVAAPAIMLTLYYVYRKQIAGPSFGFIIKSILVGLVISAPWWIINYQRAIGYAVYASGSGSGDPRHALGSSLMEKLEALPALYAVTALGPALTVLFSVTLFIIIIQFLFKRSTLLSESQKGAVWVCLLSFLPMFLIHATGGNQNMRFIIVPLIPLLIAFAILVNGSGLTKKPWFVLLASMLFIFQAYQIGASFNMSESEGQLRAEKRGYFGGGPSEIMGRRDDTRWDWESLYALAQSNHITMPFISSLGGGSAFNPPHLIYPWIRRGESVKAKRLWRYEHGVIDWTIIKQKVQLSNIVITAPDYIGNPLDKQDLDNQHNKAFVALMNANPKFKEPVEIWQGESTPVKFLVYFKRPEGLN